MKTRHAADRVREKMFLRIVDRGQVFYHGCGQLKICLKKVAGTTRHHSGRERISRNHLADADKCSIFGIK
jgi:hypothetical protein